MLKRAIVRNENCTKRAAWAAISKSASARDLPVRSRLNPVALKRLRRVPLKFEVAASRFIEFLEYPEARGQMAFQAE
jgi:hypothetical protein